MADGRPAGHPEGSEGLHAVWGRCVVSTDSHVFTVDVITVCPLCSWSIHCVYVLQFYLGARVCPGRALAYLELKALVVSLARRAAFVMVDPEEAWMPVGGPVNGLELDFATYRQS